MREHVTLYAHENPDLFSIEFVPPDPSVFAPTLALYVDTAEDLSRVRTISAGLSSRQAGLAEVVAVARELLPPGP